jgi:hypothetical protein
VDGCQEARADRAPGRGTIGGDTVSDLDIKGLDDNDLASLRAAGKSVPRKAAGSTVASRSKREKASSPLDGRRLPTTRPAEVPLNVDVPPEVKELAVRARADFGLPMKVFVAQAIQRHWRALEIELQSQPTEEGHG